MLTNSPREGGLLEDSVRDFITYICFSLPKAVLTILVYAVLNYSHQELCRAILLFMRLPISRMYPAMTLFSSQSPPILRLNTRTHNVIATPHREKRISRCKLCSAYPLGLPLKETIQILTSKPVRNRANLCNDNPWWWLVPPMTIFVYVYARAYLCVSCLGLA